MFACTKRAALHRLQRPALDLAAVAHRQQHERLAVARHRRLTRAGVHARGTIILGVSTDSAKSHDKFVEKFKLPFMLLADEDKKIVEAYGVWGEKSFMGRKYLGTNRVTFLIAPDGKIRGPDTRP